MNRKFSSFFNNTSTATPVSAAAMFVGLPVDFVVDNARFLRSGYIETDTSKFDANIWTSATVISTVATSVFGSSNIVGIAYNGADLYVAVTIDGKVGTSLDGLNWTLRTVPASFKEGAFITFGNGIWILGGRDTATTTNEEQLLTSPDGINWTKRGTDSVSVSISNGSVTDAVYGNGTWVAITNTQHTLVSTDNGVTWTKSASLGYGLYKITYGNELFVAAGHTGIVSTSSDGLIWTQRVNPSGSTSTGTAVAFSGTHFVLSYDTKSIISNDGINWSDVIDLQAMFVRDLGYKDGLWVAVGDNRMTYISRDDGATWSRTTGSALTNTFQSLAMLSGDTFILCSSMGAISKDKVCRYAGALTPFTQGSAHQYVRIS